MDAAALKEDTRIKTGIFSGSFNPIHIGHLALANWLCEFAALDELWFVVSPHNPLKSRGTLMDDDTRLRLVEAAVEGYPKFRASDIEFSLPRPSYSIDTLRTLEERYPDRQFHFIMGADNWAAVHRWKEGEELVRRYPVIIYPRKGYDVHIPSDIPTARSVDAPLLEISSTFIRESVRAGKDVRFFLPETIRGFFYGQQPLFRKFSEGTTD